MESPPAMPRESVSPATDIQLTLGEQSTGLLLSGVDCDGREATTPDSQCAFVIVSGVRPRSQAAEMSRACGPLVGLPLKSIQGQSVYGLTVNETADILSSAGRPVTILFGPPNSHGQLAADASDSENSNQPAVVGRLTDGLRLARAECTSPYDTHGGDNQELASPPQMPRDSVAAISGAAPVWAAPSAGPEFYHTNSATEGANGTVTAAEVELRQSQGREAEIVAAVESKRLALENEEAAVGQQVAAEDQVEDKRRRQLLEQLRAVANVPLSFSQRGEVIRIGEFPPPHQHRSDTPGLCGLVACDQLLGSIRAALLGASISGGGSNRRFGLWGGYGSGLTSLLHEVAAEERVQVPPCPQLSSTGTTTFIFRV